MTPLPYVILFRPSGFLVQSGMEPVTRYFGARKLMFSPAWSRLEKKSWTLGNALRQWGIRHYGSKWNALVPWRDEKCLTCRRKNGSIDAAKD